MRLLWARVRSIFGVKHLYARAHSTRSPAVPGLNGVCGLALSGDGMAFAGGPRCGPPAIPWRRARLASGRLCRRLSGGRTLDAVVLHHADPARGIPARHDLLVVGVNRLDARQHLTRHLELAEETTRVARAARIQMPSQLC